MMPDPQLAGDVGGGEDGRRRPARPGVVRCRWPATSARAWSASTQGGVQHARRHRMSSMKSRSPRDSGSASYLVPGRADAARPRGFRDRRALGQRLDRVEDLHVPGAAAEVGSQVAGWRPRGSGPVPFLSIRALARMMMPGRAEAALQARRRQRRPRRSAGARRRPRLRGCDLLALGSLERDLAGHHALPSSRTVQQPHWPEGAQPSLGEVTSSSSRRAARRWGWSPRTLSRAGRSAEATRR